MILKLIESSKHFNLRTLLFILTLLFVVSLFSTCDNINDFSGLTGSTTPSFNGCWVGIPNGTTDTDNWLISNTSLDIWDVDGGSGYIGNFTAIYGGAHSSACNNLSSWYQYYIDFTSVGGSIIYALLYLQDSNTLFMSYTSTSYNDSCTNAATGTQTLTISTNTATDCP